MYSLYSPKRKILRIEIKQRERTKMVWWRVFFHPRNEKNIGKIHWNRSFRDRLYKDYHSSFSSLSFLPNFFPGILPKRDFIALYSLNIGLLSSDELT